MMRAASVEMWSFLASLTAVNEADRISESAATPARRSADLVIVIVCRTRRR